MAETHRYWSREEFEQQLRSLGDRYHIYHPYQVDMNAGRLNREQIQGWVANRFYYQVSIPIKDASLLANCPDRAVRRQWVQRIIDHDGREGEEGGIEAWLRLGEACGMNRDDIASLKLVLPGVRFAVDAYVNFVRRAPWQEAVCSSLTELFAPTIHRERLKTWPEFYPWMDSTGFEYFRNRLSEAHRDVEHGLEVTLDHFVTREQQLRALEILRFKLDVLWTMLDAMYMAYVMKMPPYHNIRKEE
ncbi:MAG TPA: pyrroloquinoline-quinone synthase PqqC [Arenicellales bacterium]|nr:pyrroloquinoline-quinone synthase PqqC [Arenicellales bacterium]